MNAECHRVLEWFAELQEKQGWPYWVTVDGAAPELGLEPNVILDCLRTLEAEDYLAVGATVSGSPLPIALNVLRRGFLWAVDQLPDRKTDWLAAVQQAARTFQTSHAIAEATEVPEGAVRQLLDLFEEQGLLDISCDTGGWTIYRRSSTL